jgi:predicted ATPase
MGIHVGESEERDNDYFGPAVNRVARLMSAGHGGQILLSLPAAELARDSLPATVQLRDLGEHRLKDLSRPEHIFQLVAVDLPADFPPLATLDFHPNNLPPQLTPLVGREREMQAVCDLIGRDDIRLVTLTGPGGTGKTRLSLQVGTELIDAYPEGVWFVPLENATDETVVVGALAQALGVREVAGQPLVEGLTDFLRGKQLLILLDNFEQVVHVAPLVARLLGQAPRLEFLITSRIRLGVQGEHEYGVPPLDVPDNGAVSPADLMGCSAVRLFVERAQAAKSDFALTDDNASAVVEISRRLDGLPLAIELAAARVKLLPPRAMLSRLEHRLTLLTGGGRDRPARQQTLRGAIAWSYDLLASTERTLFARLSVCIGGCTYEATEIISNPDGDLDLLSDLEALVDHSLVRQAEDADGEPRFSMLATIREYAAEQLKAAEEAEAIHERHADWCLQLAETAEPALFGENQKLWLTQLEREHDNLRGALAWLVEHGRAEGAVRLAGALARFWEMHGHVAEGRQLLEAALAMQGDVPPNARAKALRGLAALMVVQGDYAPATEHYEESLALHREQGDRRSEADALAGLGDIALLQGDADRATEVFTNALAIYQSIDNTWGIAESKNGLAAAAHHWRQLDRAISLYNEGLDHFKRLGNEHHIAKTLNNLATIAHDRDDYQEAMRLYDQSLEVTRGLKDIRTSADTLNNQAIVAEEQGDIDRAAELYRQSLSMLRYVGDRHGIAYSLLGSGIVAEAHGDPAGAARQYDESLAIFQELGAQSGVAEALKTIADSARKRGDLERADQIYRQALVIWRDGHDDEGVALILIGLAAIALAQGRTDRAAALSGAVATALEGFPSPLPPADGAVHTETLAAVQAALSDADYATAWAEGSSATLDEVVNDVLAASIAADSG